MRTAPAVSAALAAIAVVRGPVSAHQIPCAHTHTPPPNGAQVHCNNSGSQTCVDASGAAGVCQSKMDRFGNFWCECVPNGGGSGCSVWGQWSLAGSQSPFEFGRIRYTVESGFSSVLLDNQTVSPPNLNLSGTVDFEFGTFINLSSVPVEVRNIDLTAPNFNILGLSTGETKIQKSLAFNATLHYDANDRTLTAKDPIIVDVTNALNGTIQVPVYFDGSFDFSGDLEINAQGRASFPLPVPDVQANGSDETIEVDSVTPVEISARLTPNDLVGVTVDWWLYVDTVFGTFSYDVEAGWIPGRSRTVRAPLFELPEITVLDTPLPLGSYYFGFGLGPPGGAGPLIVDGVLVHSQE